MNDILINGKNPKSRIVSIEPNDENCEIFTEDKQGNISSEFVPNSYFILFNEQPNKYATRLKGDLHYKWGLKYNNRENYLKARRYWKDKADTWSVYNPKENFMIRTGYTYFKDMKHTEPSILSFDIETNGLKMDEKSEVFLITNTFRKNGILIRKLFCFDEYSNQGEMIQAWCQWVREINPSILCGHNIISYDLQFLDTVARLYDNQGLQLGRDDSFLEFEKYDSKFRKDQSQYTLYRRPFIYGRNIIDTMFLAIKSDIVEKRYTTYGLKSIIKQENLEDKDRVFYDTSKIRHNIHKPEELIKIKAYAEKDADDSLKLYDLFIPPYFYLTSYIPKSFQEIICSATGSQINSFLIRSYLQSGYSIPKADEIQHFEGAISLGIPGMHKNVLSWDVKSLYPSLILHYEIHPQKKDPNKNFLNMVQYFTNQRFEYKKLYKETKDDKYKALDAVGKIFINSSYGLLGATGLNFNSNTDAASVTRLGRETLKMGVEWLVKQPYNEWKKENIKNEDTDTQ